MWDLDYKESWALKNWCFWTVVLEKTLESPLDCKKIQPVHPEGDQSWVFIGSTESEAETPNFWPPDTKSWLIWKDPYTGKDWGQEEKGTTEDEMVGWHHWPNGHGLGWTPWVGDGQRGLACCSSCGRKESNTTEWLNWTELNWTEFALIHRPNIPGSYAILLFMVPDFTSLPITSTTGCCFSFGTVSSLFLKLFLYSSPIAYYTPTNLASSPFRVILFCLFMGFSRLEYWSDLPFPSPVDHVLSELSSISHPSWVALHGIAHSFIDKAMVHVINLVSLLRLWFLVCLPSDGEG